MRLVVTDHAFERYCERTENQEVDLENFKIRLNKLRAEEIHFVNCQGKPAIYFNQIYWRYLHDETRDVFILITCLGAAEFISMSRIAYEELELEKRRRKKVKKCRVPKTDSIWKKEVELRSSKHTNSRKSYIM